MKPFPQLVLAAWLALWSIAALAAGPSYRIEVDGLACPFCAYGIEKKLGEIEGVESIQTHIKEGVVIVTMKDDAALDPAQARRAVKAAGFSLRSFAPVSGKAPK